MPCLCIVKNGHVHEGGKIGRSDAAPTNFFSVDSYDLKSMSFKFCNDVFITFEMPGSSYSRPIDKIHISLQFRPSVIRGPWVNIYKPRLIMARVQYRQITEVLRIMRLSKSF